MFGKYFKKTGTSVIGLASLLYTGCAGLPSRIMDDIKIRKPAPMYSFNDSVNYRNVKVLDKELVKHNHPEKVDLQVLVDSEFIELYDPYHNNWWKHFSQKMDSIDERFNKKFGIDFEVDGVEYIKMPDYMPNDLDSMLSWIRLHYTPEQFDAFVLLTGKKVLKSQGVCIPLGNHTVVAPEKYLYFLERITQHELSHFYNAKDIKSSDTIMSNSLFNWSFKWSEDNADRIEWNKDRVWYYHDSYIHQIKKGILEFPKEEQDEVEELFCLASGSNFHDKGMWLAKKYMKKYPGHKLINSCYQWLLDNKREEEKKE